MKTKAIYLLPAAAILAVVVIGTTAVFAKSQTPQEKLESLTKQLQALAEKTEKSGAVTTNDKGLQIVTDSELNKQADALRRQASDAISESLARPASERATAVANIKALMGNVDPIYSATAKSTYKHDVNTEFYRVGADYVEVDMRNNKVVRIGEAPVERGKATKTYNTEPKFSREELEVKAREFIAKADPNADLSKLEARVSDKEGTAYYFRWTDSSKEVDGGEKAFVQVGFTIGGDRLSYTNILSL